MTLLWIAGLVRHRLFRLAGTALGVAVTVALVATLGFFLTGSSATMTARAVDAVPIDWQVEAVPGSDPAKIESAIRKAATVSALDTALYATADGFVATTGGTVQTTGPGTVIAFDQGYLARFPQEVRLLSGDMTGVLIAQQTAANLHAGPGDTVTIKRVGLAPEAVTVTGVVELPDADALFQGVGLPKQATPQAPPDNVLILPMDAWHRIFDPQQAVRPDSTRLQFHVRLDHAGLPSQPVAALTKVSGAARNLVARVAGQALVADNLGARLDAVRGDALYATVLFLFLGLPGVALGAALTIAVAASGGDRRRAEQSLLRIRGASARRIMALAGAEAATTGIAGALIGLVFAALFAALALPLSGSAGASLLAGGIAVVFGLALAAAAVMLPAWSALRGASVTATRRLVGRGTVPVWRRGWFDLILLGAAVLLFWQTASTGYQIVLAPEGVAATSVDYKAFLAPALFWIGAALLAVRIVSAPLRANGPVLHAFIAPVAGRLAPIVGAALSHQSRRITLGIAMTALAVAFGASTAIFNTTYKGQTQVDAELTNGADVTVFGTTASPAGQKADALATLQGVTALEPMQHRFAYVGSDLQDLYGIDPARIGRVTTLSDAYFTGSSAAAILQKLQATPDGVLVSQETVNDFQLSLGDTINLRLMSAADHQYHPVPFHFIGIAREFPTAPKDSFLVANSDYIAQMTGDPAQDYILMKATGDPAALARAATALVADVPALTVKDIGSVTHIIGSSLTAVNMDALTRIELAFAVLMAAAAAGLMLALGFRDRQRGFAILTAIGAKPRQLGAFLWSEGMLVIAGGVVLGLAAGTVIAWMLVKLLTGVFDPPPEALAMPWGWLMLLIVLVAVSVAGAVLLTMRGLRQDAVDLLRDL